MDVIERLNTKNMSVEGRGHVGYKEWALYSNIIFPFALYVCFMFANKRD